MKCLCIISQGHSIKKSVTRGFNANNWQVKDVDFKTFFTPAINSFVTCFESIPNKLKKNWKTPYIGKINKDYIKVFEQEKPDLVFIYNNQHLLPNTVKTFSKKAKVAFILGDNPLYTPTNPYNVQILKHADYIICPDTFWLQQLRTMGINNLHFDCFGFDPDFYHPINLSEEQKKQYSCELGYIGTAHKSNWGYKRFLFLNQFTNFNLKAYITGNGYEKVWVKSFPELKKHIIRHDFIDQKFNNVVYNACKIAPIELVPSLFNGIHIRIFDALGAGTFPLCEYSKDLEAVFHGLDFPVIKSYPEAEEVTTFLLNNDSHRQKLINDLKERVEINHNPKIVVTRLLESVF